MDTQIFLVTVLALGSMNLASCVTATPKDTPTPFTLTSSKSNSPPLVVYTAETARQLHTVRPDTDRPKPSTEPENLGFVDPNDFASTLPKFDFEKSDDAYPEFFRSNYRGSNRPQTRYEEDIESDPPEGSLTSSSNYNSRRHDGKDSTDGFVDPNIQFRSLFDAAETEGGFSPSDFLNYNNENSGTEGSKSAQTQAFPSYTYTGRQDDDAGRGRERRPSDFPSSQPPNKYRSNYRQVTGRNGAPNGYDRNDNQGVRDSGEGIGRGPAPLRYNDDDNDGYYNNQNRGPRKEDREASEETNDSPEATPQKGKGGDSPKSKCKKVVKEVDDEPDYSPEYAPDDYDPATYQSRYKRQANRGGKQSSNKRPMTCYVCEAADGRYAEKCSYESNADPNKKGGYFHSSSTSFTDNGKPRGRKERSKREPATDYTPTSFELTPGGTESLPKRIQKRQSEGNRYASHFQGDRGNNHEQRGQGGSQRGDFEYIPSVSREVARNGNSNRHPDFQFGPPATFGQNTQNSPRYQFDFSLPNDLQRGFTQSDDTSANPESKPTTASETGFGADFDIGYDDYVKKHFPEAYGPTRSSPSHGQAAPHGGSAPTGSDVPSFDYRSPPRVSEIQYEPETFEPRGHGGQGQFQPTGPHKANTQQQRQYSVPHYYDEVGPQHLERAITQFNQKDRKQCQKVQKDGMTCFVCRDPRGMNKEECMYASNPSDPRSGKMEYHEVSEYSSDPQQNAPQEQPPSGSAEESKKVEKETGTQAPFEYDFDY